MWHQLYVPHSTPNISSMMTQLSFLTALASRLKETPQDVVAEMGVVRDRLTAAENLRVFVTADISALPAETHPLQPWTMANFPLTWWVLFGVWVLFKWKSILQ